MSVWLIVAGAGLMVGLLLGRWWTLAAPAALGIWIATVSELDEVPGWFIGLVYALSGAVGVTAGVLLRRLAARS